jgi:hypothetical protein
MFSDPLNALPQRTVDVRALRLIAHRAAQTSMRQAACRHNKVARAQRAITP